MDDKLIISLIVGIVSSLLATVLFIGVSELIRRVIIPWYADKIYRGVRIDGDWELCHIKEKGVPDNGAYMRLTLEQKGDKIKGVYSHKGKDEAADEYILDGRIRDMYFLATAVPKSNRQIDGISFLLHIEYDKSRLAMNGNVLSQGKPGEVSCHENLVFKLKQTK